MKKRNLALLVGLTSALFLTACGSSSSSSDEKKVVRGSIDGFGSVIVNGVRYNTDNATISVKDKQSTQGNLNIGQVVTVYGSSNGSNGVASNIIYDLDLKGPITSINGKSFVVLGQTVHTNKLTTYKGITLPLDEGQWVEVNGYTSGDDIVASYVELEDNSDDKNEVELRGTVANLDESAKTFKISGQVVDYSVVSDWDLEGKTLANGLRVEVEGTLVGGVVIAEEIEADDDVFEKGTKLEIKGVISNYNEDTKSFEVNGTKVVWNNNTDFDDINANQLTDGLLVEVEGRVNADGVLLAEEIEHEDDGSISIETTISEVTAGKDKFSGTLTIFGIQVKVDMNTRMRDDSDNPNFNPMFNFSDLNTGDKVELDITGDATNGYRAVKLERDFDEDDLSNVEVEVPASLIDLENKTVLGVSYELAEGALLQELQDLIDNNANLDEVEVEIKGTVNGGVLTITKVEIDD